VGFFAPVGRQGWGLVYHIHSRWLFRRVRPFAAYRGRNMAAKSMHKDITDFFSGGMQ